MIYRSFGKHRISVLGLELLGAETLTRDIDWREYLHSVSRGIELGVNYFDLGFPDFQRISTQVVSECGALLSDSGVITSLRVNIFDVESAEKLEQSVKDILNHYGLDHAGLLQLWGINRTTWVKIQETGILSRAKELIRAGLVGDLTLCFMDDRFYLKPILESESFDGLTIEYSFMDIGRGAGNLKTASDFDIDVIAHGALKDGRLTGSLPQEIKKIWDDHPERSIAGWSLGAVWDRPEISCALVEATSVRNIEEYARIAEFAAAGKLGVRELLLIKQVRELYQAKRQIQCELCRCCMPCPLGINAPRIAELVNEALMYGDNRIPVLRYKLEKHDGSLCSRCMRCVRACPREFMLPDIILEAGNMLQ